MKNYFLLIAVLLVSPPSFSQQVQWCGVNSAGNILYCLPTLGQCQTMIRGDEKEKTCVALPVPK